MGSFDIKKITSINIKSGFTYKLSIKSSFDEIEISVIGKSGGQKIVNKIKEIQNKDELRKQSTAKKEIILGI